MWRLALLALLVSCRSSAQPGVSTLSSAKIRSILSSTTTPLPLLHLDATAVGIETVPPSTAIAEAAAAIHALSPHLSPAPSFGTCAVVGSSGRLLGAGLGKMIDGHDVVIRINSAPIVERIEGASDTSDYYSTILLSHALDVGNRTDVRFWANTLHRAVVEEEESHLVNYPIARTEDYERHRNQLRDMAAPGHDGQRVGGIRYWGRSPRGRSVDPARHQILPPHFMLHLLQQWFRGTPDTARWWGVADQTESSSDPARRYEGLMPSTGLVGIVWATHACRSVSVFGFGIDPPPAPLRYYDGDVLARAAARGNENKNFQRVYPVTEVTKIFIP